MRTSCTKKDVGGSKMSTNINPEIEAQSLSILKSITEDRGELIRDTYIGTVADVRKDEDFDSNGSVIYVLAYAGGYVYMKSVEAPSEFLNIAPEDLIGREAPFKVLNVMNNKIFVSYRFIADSYILAYQRGNILSGKIIGSHYDRDNIDDSYFVVRCHGDRLRMYRPEYSIYSLPTYLPLCHDQRVNFKVLGIDSSGTIQVSKAEAEKIVRDSALEKLKSHPEGDIAEITKLTESSAYLVYHGAILILKNKDFSTDYTPSILVKKKGDSLMVRFLYESPKKRIFVEAVPKYTSPSTPISQFHIGDALNGIVVNDSLTSKFIRIAPGIDVKCDARGQDILRGTKVQVCITDIVEGTNQIHQKVSKLRGYIVRTIDPSTNLSFENKEENN